MAKLFFGAALLIGLVNVSLSLHAQGSVSLSVCNAGNVAVDALVGKESHVVSSHIAPGTCADVYSEHAGIRAYLGFAFVDSHGQWGTAHRLDLMPDFGLDVLTTAAQNVSVRRGNTDAPAQMQMLFRPRNPTCSSPPSSTYAEDHLPFNATAAQRAIAAQQDRNNSSLSQPTCEPLGYTLNVVAYPDTREVTFKEDCAKCRSKETPLTAEQKAAGQQTVRALSSISPGFAGLVNRADKEAAKEAKDREERLKPPQGINWSDLLPALKRVPMSGGRPPEMPQNIVIRGTVSRIEEAPANAWSEHWVNVYFKESPDAMFGVCALGPEIFQDALGANFRTSMIGKPLEVVGEFQRYYCKEYKGSIRVTLSRQLHPVNTAQFDVAATLWKPRDVPRLPAGPPPVLENPYDPDMPGYSVTSKMAGSALNGYCSGIYDPAETLLTPEQSRFRNANQAAVKAEVQKCVSRFDPVEVAAHRRIAMRYCLGNNDYTDRLHGGRIKPYVECMYKNDTLTAFCTQELKYRAELEHMPNVADQTCRAPIPNGREILVILKGGHDDIGHPVVIPSTGPGLPAILLSPMEPGILQRAGVSTANNRQVAAPGQSVQQAPKPAILAQPVPAPSPSSAAPEAKAARGQLDRAQMNAAAQQKRQQQIAEQRMQAKKYAACKQQAVKDHPEGGGDLVKAYRSCIQALTQRPTTSK